MTLGSPGSGELVESEIVEVAEVFLMTVVGATGSLGRAQGFFGPVVKVLGGRQINGDGNEANAGSEYDHDLN